MLAHKQITKAEVASVRPKKKKKKTALPMGADCPSISPPPTAPLVWCRGSLVVVHIHWGSAPCSPSYTTAGCYITRSHRRPLSRSGRVPMSRRRRRGSQPRPRQAPHLHGEGNLPRPGARTIARGRATFCRRATTASSEIELHNSRYFVTGC